MYGYTRFYPNNFHLYSDPQRKFVFLPWGLDMTWKPFHDGAPHLPMLGVGPPGNDPRRPITAGLVFQRCLASAPCRARYVAIVRELLGVMEAARLDALAATYREQIRPAPAHRPAQVPQDAECEASFQTVLRTIRDRGRPGPAGPGGARHRHARMSRVVSARRCRSFTARRPRACWPRSAGGGAAGRPPAAAQPALVQERPRNQTAGPAIQIEAGRYDGGFGVAALYYQPLPLPGLTVGAEAGAGFTGTDRQGPAGAPAPVAGLRLDAPGAGPGGLGGRRSGHACAARVAGRWIESYLGARPGPGLRAADRVRPDGARLGGRALRAATVGDRTPTAGARSLGLAAGWKLW